MSYVRRVSLDSLTLEFSISPGNTWPAQCDLARHKESKLATYHGKGKSAGVCVLHWLLCLVIWEDTKGQDCC